MKSPFKFSLKDKEILKTIYRFAKARKVKLYLVGGILRDLLLGREKDNLDIDFCLKRGALSFGRNLAKEMKAGYVVLDKEHSCCRLVKRLNNKTYTLDFTDFRGRNLGEDLLYRDFTINTLSMELDKMSGSKNWEDFLIDPYGARRDLKSRIIRIVNKRSFDDDPLRILRAFSLSAIFDFKIDKETLKLIKLKREKLSGVSEERIRDELFKLLDAQNSFYHLTEMDRLKILKIILPEIEKMHGVGQGPYHHLDVWEHTLETIRQFELLMKEFKNNNEIQNYLNEFISGDRRRRALLKLGAFLHDVGKPDALRHKNGKTIFHGHERIGLEITENIAKRLKLSNDEINSLRKMILCHLRPGYLADNQVLTPRAKFRYFRDTNDEAVSTLLLSIADQRATKGPLTTQVSRVQHEKVCNALIKEFFRKKKEKKVVRLINGDDLLKKFRLEPSPLIGKILSEIEELQAIGKIKTKKEAFRIAKKFIK